MAHIKRMDWILVASAFLLAAFGLLSIYSSSLFGGDFLNFQKQIIFLGAGFFLMILVSTFDYRILRNDSYLILFFYFFCLLGLAGLFFFAPETRGVRAWYRLGPVSLDPIEFTRLILVILLAKYFSTRHIEMYQIRHVFLSGVYVFLPSVLIFFQPNLGSVLVLLILWFSVLLISGIKIRHLFLLLVCGLLVLILAWQFFLQDYQKGRVLSFLHPQLEPLGVGWNQTQSKIAIGSGGIFGSGIGNGSQTQYGFLPEAKTDFIFAALAEETGLAGVAVLMVLFLVLIWRIFKITLASQTNFSRFFASGLGVILVSQILINIGMNLGILPVIGIPLPFVSYGGGGLVVNFVALGILQNIKINN